MPNWCQNKLKISGSIEEMNKFYAELNSEKTTEFSMGKFFAIPEVLSERYSSEDFKVCDRKIIKLRDGTEKEVDVDSKNRTKEEFKKNKIVLEEIYGYNNSNDWCINNWGCRSDITYLKELKQNNNEYVLTYFTPWSPNTDFIKFLSNKYSELHFQLDYVESSMCYAGTLNCKGKRNVLIEYDNRCIFLKNTKSKKYKFIKEESYENGCMLIDIIGVDWKQSLLDDGFAEKNIINWVELKKHLDSIELDFY